MFSLAYIPHSISHPVPDALDPFFRDGRDKSLSAATSFPSFPSFH